MRDIARRCRTSSIRRKWLREFDIHGVATREKIEIIQQGTLGAKDREQQATAAQRSLAVMTKITTMDDLGLDSDDRLKSTVSALEQELAQAVGMKAPAAPLANLTPAKRKIYEHMFGLIYECSTNQVAARSLIDRILRKIE
jgi:molecular chaperone HtpG